MDEGKLGLKPAVELVPQAGGSAAVAFMHRPASEFSRVQVSEDAVFTGSLSLSTPVTIEDVRVATEAEIAALPEPVSSNTAPAPSAGRTVPTIQHLRERHHEMARLLAAGVSISEVAEILQVSKTTIAHIRNSPQFQDLLHGYMAARDERAIDIGARIKATAAVYLDKLSAKVEGADPATLPGDFLQKTTAMLLDRAGHSPVQKQVNLNAALSPADIRAIRAARPAAVVESATAGLLIEQASAGPEGGGTELREEAAEPLQQPLADSQDNPQPVAASA